MIRELFEAGIQRQIDEGNEREKEKLGYLRAGNTGMINSDGDIIGSCAAATYLRMKGINGKPVDINKELMFAGGRLNEDHWISVLQSSGFEGKILAEEDIPTRWETSNGVPVTGRPDIVLCQTEDKPTVGIELKQVMSINSAYNVLVAKEPQLKHLMQAAHYMWQLDCPFELWYTNRNNLDMPSWMEFREFPKPEDELSGRIQYRYYRMGDINPRTNKPKKHQISEEQYLSGEFKKTFGVPGKILPFIQGFNLQLKKERLYYQDAMVNNAPWVETIVNIPDIRRFYEYISELDEYGKVPKPALNLKPDGKPLGWKFSAYSDLGHLDPEFWAGKKLDKWVKMVETHLQEDE